MSEKTPGALGTAHPIPQLTTPIRVAAPLLLSSLTIRGPPLSPLHASLPPSIQPAQNISGVICPLGNPQLDFPSTSTFTSYSSEFNELSIPVVREGHSFLRKNKIFAKKRVWFRKKRNNGQTKWIIQRNEKTKEKNE